MPIDSSVKALNRANKIIQAANQLRDGLQGVLNVVSDSGDGLDLTAIDFSTTTAKHVNGELLDQAMTGVQLVAQFADTHGLDGQPLPPEGGTSIRATILQVCTS